jgi:hypothetical protein
LLVSVTNESATPIEISRFRTTCDCVVATRLDTAGGAVESGATCDVRLVIDLGAQPDWQGDLAVEVEGVDAEEVCVIAFTVTATVRPDHIPDDLGSRQELRF